MLMEDGGPVRLDWKESSHKLSQEDRTTAEKMAEDKASDGIDFTKVWTYADITFLVEEKRIYSNKMILSMWSPVFEAMFRNNFKEKNAKEINLPGKKFDDVIALMKVLHPPCEEITGDMVVLLLPLAQEYQMEKVTERCEEVLLGQASSIKNFLIAQKFGLKKLEESTMGYLKRAPVSRLKTQAEFKEIEHETLVELLMEKCTKFESHVESLREVRMVLERKKPTTFPGMHLLCNECTAAREQQVECTGCMKECCKKLTEILRNMER